MKLSDITIFHTGPYAFRICSKPSDQTNYILIGLIHDSYFIKMLKELRTKYKIPPSRYSYKNLQKSSLFIQTRM